MTLEETGANTETEKQFLYNIYTALLNGVEPRPGKTRTETYEDTVKELFQKEPASMRLLVVVDKLLTGSKSSRNISMTRRFTTGCRCC